MSEDLHGRRFFSRVPARKSGRPRRATGRRDRAANMVLSAVTAMMLATILHSPLAFSSTVTPSTYTEDKTTLLQPGDMTGVDDVDVSKVSSFLRGHEGFSLGQDDVSMGIEGEWTPAVDNEISFTLGVHHEGDGGKLRDGRDRCFTDEEGYRRCYPTAFFIGTSKCATTSLARWLDEHPSTHWVANPRRPNQVEETGVKEAHVFDNPPKKGWVTAHQIELHNKMAITAPKTDADSVVIDYTPHYLAVAETPHRISDMYGGRDSGLKFIVTLREPVGRTISSWEFKNEFNYRKGRKEESRSLSETIRDGVTRATKLDVCLSTAREKPISPRSRDLKICNPRTFLEQPMFVSHVGKSLYAIQLERWFDVFGPENFKIIFTEDMAADPVKVVGEVLEFLGLESMSDDDSKGLPTRQRWDKVTGMAYNKTRHEKKDELNDQITDEIKEQLWNFFEPHNEALEVLLGHSLPSSWK